MATGVMSWSTLTGATNATTDSNVNWAEGQSPGSVNDSARNMMSSVAKWRDDISGILVSAGTGTAYTITSNQIIAANTNGMMVQFTPGTTNTGAVTLSVDGNTARPLRFYTGIDLPAGVLISGSLYQATYRLSTTEWLLHSFDASIYAIPLGGMIDYAGSTAPNSAFVLPQGQAISRTTYATLFSLISTTYGVGDNSTTFNVPDLVGRVAAMRDGGSARLSSSFFGGNPASLGAVGGAEQTVLTASQIPSITSVNATQSITVTTAQKVVNGPNAGSATAGGTQVTAADIGSGGNLNLLNSTGSNSISVTSNNTSGLGHRTVQPTIILNKILRII